MTKDVRTQRTLLKSLKEALRERLSPEQFSRIFALIATDQLVAKLFPKSK